MTSPYLSFFYDLSGASTADRPACDVRVQRGTLIDDPARDQRSIPDGWQPAFYDLRDWEGQAITLTFRVRNVAGQAGALALVDEVNLGSARPDLWVDALSDVDYAMPGETVVQTSPTATRAGLPPARR